MTIHQNHYIASSDTGFYCQTCADQGTIEASLCNEIAGLYAELSKRIEFWECPDCAFRFSAEHVDNDGKYSCPVCAEAKLRTELATIEKELDRHSTIDKEFQLIMRVHGLVDNVAALKSLLENRWR